MAVLRFLADENVSQRVVHVLRESGYDVIDVKETKRLGWSDERLLAWASSKSRVILTHDKDFAGLLKSPMGRRHAGVILIRLHNQHPARVVEQILPVLAKLRSRRLRNALVIVGHESIEYLRG